MHNCLAPWSQTGRIHTHVAPPPQHQHALHAYSAPPARICIIMRHSGPKGMHALSWRLGATAAFRTHALAPWPPKAQSAHTHSRRRATCIIMWCPRRRAHAISCGAPAGAQNAISCCAPAGTQTSHIMWHTRRRANNAISCGTPGGAQHAMPCCAPAGTQHKKPIMWHARRRATCNSMWHARWRATCNAMWHAPPARNMQCHVARPPARRKPYQVARPPARNMQYQVARPPARKMGCHVARPPAFAPCGACLATGPNCNATRDGVHACMKCLAACKDDKNVFGFPENFFRRIYRKRPCWHK